MALVVKDRVQEASTTSGTGTLTFSGPIPGFQSFSSSIGNGNTTFYTIYDNVAQVWEVGIGTVGAGTLARTTVLSNSSGTTTPISLAGNTSSVFCTYPAEKSINYDANGVATIGEVLGYADTGIIGSFASTVAGYNQVIVQNKSTATNASSNLNVSNDAGTAGSNYAELGINSSTFTGTGSFNIAGASYVASASTDLTLGTYGAYNVHFVTNSSTTDAMTIYNNGGISLGTFGNPGIGNMAASKFVPGYTTVTSAAGTTVLTADSNYYQNLLGSTTQTFQLPDATTLLEGTTFIFDNDSSGTLTVVDNASGPIETVPGGAAGFVYLANNSTVAGTWRRHAFLPASYDFNNTTANFGTATITNASWNGNTIGTAYGGTGLTTFGSANYALYSTSSSALVAGTLPTAAGGTALTSYTTGDIIYASATNTLSKLAAGTNGHVLTLASGIPSWAANNAATTRTVSTFTATAGQTTFTVAYIVGLIDVFRNGVKLAGSDFTATNGTSVVLATGANLGDTVETIAYSALSISTGVTSFSAGATGLSPASGTGNITLGGTLNVASGGTGTSTAFTTGSVVFAGTSGVYSQDNANLFWDNANDRLGIGTTSPATTLDVNGEASFGNEIKTGNGVTTGGCSIELGGLRTGDGNSFIDFHSTSGTDNEARIIRTSGVNGSFAISNTGTGDFNITNASTGNINLNSIGAGNILLSTTNAERMRIDSSGNVGIGTSSPTAKLHSYSTTGAPLTVDVSSGNPSNIQFSQNGTTKWFIRNLDTSNAFSFYDATAGAERMRIDSSGNVGIGTTSPAGRLDITQATNGSAFVVNALGGSNPNFIVSGSGEQTFRLYNTAPTGSTRTSIKLASRLNTDWEWIAYTDGAGTGINDLTIANLAGPALTIDASRNLQFNSGYGSVATAYGCRAWVRFNGTGTVAINGSGNVSSITDNGAGLYTLNFTTAMSDANYSVSGFASNNDDGANESYVVGRNNTSTYTTSACQITTTENTASSTVRQDSPLICVQIFR
jgi:hypothetical protein